MSERLSGCLSLSVIYHRRRKTLHHRDPLCSLSFRGSVTYLKLGVNMNQRFVLLRFGIRLVIWTWIVFKSKVCLKSVGFHVLSSHGGIAS